MARADPRLRQISMTTEPVGYGGEQGLLLFRGEGEAIASLSCCLMFPLFECILVVWIKANQRSVRVSASFPSPALAA
eukprot:751765-Hanusia_phi.AAC.1